MLLTKKVEIKWNYVTREYYKDKGYCFTKDGELFIVDIKDLKCGSHAEVEVECDYCGIVLIKTYKSYNQQKNNGDCCKECKAKKIKVSNMKKYGKENVMQIPEFKDKLEKTIIKRYGVSNYSQTREYKHKFKETSLKRFGVEHPFQSEEVKYKAKQTCLKRYGVSYAQQNPYIKSKSIATLVKNGNVNTSSQQLYVYNILKENGYNVKLNFPFSRCVLDIALFIDGLNINIEYDCEYWHDPQKDRRRDEFMKSQGWKVIRIIGGHKLPTLEQMEKAINNVFEKSFQSIILEDWSDKYYE